MVIIILAFMGVRFVVISMWLRMHSVYNQVDSGIQADINIIDPNLDP